MANGRCKNFTNKVDYLNYINFVKFVSNRDGTRNSSSLDPRGPKPFFTPRFPEE